MSSVMGDASPGVFVVDDEAMDSALVAGSPLKFVESKARASGKQARDDVGRWRKIYYRLRRSGGSEAEIRAAYDLAKDSELHVAMGVDDPKNKTESFRKKLAGSSLSDAVDERVNSSLIKGAMDGARLARRLEALGPDTMVNFNSLPQAMQDALKRYMKQTNLEDRISKHFGPFTQGKVQRSVKDILNILDRTMVDAQTYRKGYDMKHK